MDKYKINFWSECSIYDDESPLGRFRYLRYPRYRWPLCALLAFFLSVVVVFLIYFITILLQEQTDYYLLLFLLIFVYFIILFGCISWKKRRGEIDRIQEEEEDRSLVGICPYCGHRNPIHSKRCQRCGRNIG